MLSVLLCAAPQQSSKAATLTVCGGLPVKESTRPVGRRPCAWLDLGHGPPPSGLSSKRHWACWLDAEFAGRHGRAKRPAFTVRRIVLMSAPR